MFGQAGAMQLSAANLLIASQQIARGVQPPPHDAQFAATLAKENSAPAAAAFEPIEFKQAAPDQSPSTTAAMPGTTAFGRASPLGGNVDIRV